MSIISQRKLFDLFVFYLNVETNIQVFYILSKTVMLHYLSFMTNNHKKKEWCVWALSVFWWESDTGWSTNMVINMKVSLSCSCDFINRYIWQLVHVILAITPCKHGDRWCHRFVMEPSGTQFVFLFVLHVPSRLSSISHLKHYDPCSFLCHDRLSAL